MAVNFLPRVVGPGCAYVQIRVRVWEEQVHIHPSHRCNHTEKETVFPPLLPASKQSGEKRPAFPSGGKDSLTHRHSIKHK